jgi:tripartite-type tricarboxylate transporter receptor subunit TctC
VRVGTPADIVRTLGKGFSDAMASSELKEWCTRHGAAPMRMTTGEFARFVADEAERAVAITRGGPSD